MTSRSELRPSIGREQADYGFARVRDQAFDAVQVLWHRRQAEGMKQKEIATLLGRNPAWVSRNLSAPGNWTLRTFGEFMQALGGEAEIRVLAMEDAVAGAGNDDACDGYRLSPDASPAPAPR